MLARDLNSQAVAFANELTQTTRAVAPKAAPFLVSAVGADLESRLFIRQDPASGIVLTVDSVPLLRLEVSIQCVFDHRAQYLAVEDSKITVTTVPGSNEPLLRYEYVRSPTSGVPCAHLQVHAHRDAVTFVMARSGSNSRRGRRRRAEADSANRVPQLSDLHMPLGGARYRPCLEDVLEMLIDELGVDAPDGAMDTLAAGRAEWRRKQLGAAIRDSPQVAARALVDLGYSVTPPDAGHPAERAERLSAL